jgi:LuxR family transcriptional regulator of csgAB operon
MGEDARGCQVFILGEKTIQTTLLAEFLRLNLRDHCLVLDDIPENELRSLNGGTSLLLMDFSFLTEDVLVSLLDRVTDERRKQTFVAIFNVNREEPHDYFLEWPEVRGIFYDDTTQGQLLKGVRALLEGECWFARDLVNRYLHRHRAGKKRPAGSMQAVLTSKEQQILDYVATGHSNKEIASRLNISDRTVKTHVYNIFKKINVKNRVQAVNWVQNRASPPGDRRF